MRCEVRGMHFAVHDDTPAIHYLGYDGNLNNILKIILYCKHF